MSGLMQTRDTILTNGRFGPKASRKNHRSGNIGEPYRLRSEPMKTSKFVRLRYMHIAPSLI
jgi:hypothetical protein